MGGFVHWMGRVTTAVVQMSFNNSNWAQFNQIKFGLNWQTQSQYASTTSKVLQSRLNVPTWPVLVLPSAVTLCWPASKTVVSDPLADGPYQPSRRGSRRAFSQQSGSHQQFCSKAWGLHRIVRLHFKRNIRFPALRKWTRTWNLRSHSSLVPMHFVHAAADAATLCPACVKLSMLNGKRSCRIFTATFARWSGGGLSPSAVRFRLFHSHRRHAMD